MAEPITRREQYLAAIAGEDVPIPKKPITREEQYLYAILMTRGVGEGSVRVTDDDDGNVTLAIFSEEEGGE